MSKFLLISSVAAMLYGDCVWGMDDNPWADVSSQNNINSEESASSSGSDQFNAESIRENASSRTNSRRNSRQFNAELSQNNSSPRMRSRRNSREDARVYRQDAQTQTEQAQPQQLGENRFIKIGGQNYLQHHYVQSNNSKIGHATPTTLVTVTGDDLKGWNDISEIRYANDVSYDKLENPKVILYRNKDNSCYIILRIGGNKHGVFYGINEKNVELGGKSFSAYDVSEDVGSFTDDVSRLIYADESGLYFVPKAENSVENVIDTYQKEGKFVFKGSVIKVSAVDGTITWDGKPITKHNFFDNWIQEEREVEREVSKERGRTVIEKVKETKQILSTKQPKSEEIIRNFYPPKGDYIGMLIGKEKRDLSYNNWLNNGWLNIFDENSWQKNSNEVYSGGREWIDFFIDKRRHHTKEINVQKCEELITDGTFASILYRYAVYNDKRISDIVVSNGGSTSHRENGNLREYRNSPRDIIRYNDRKLEDPSFVKNLKQGFAEIEKDFEYTKGTDMWLPFKIVRNL